ncbi:MAG: GDP-mannose 4,6-dehydratase [Anaerolineae bacterium]
MTGGAGFIGSHLAEALLKQGHQVTIIDDLSTGRFENIAHLAGHPSFRFAIETITNETVMDRLVSECDVIFHLAAAVGVQLVVSRPVQVIETNVYGSAMVLRLANRYRCKVLLASTSEVYGKGLQVPFREEDDRLLGPTTRSRWSYACSKAMDEFLALAYHKQYNLPMVIFRLFNIIGPRQTGRYGMVVPRFVRQALRGDPITVYGDGRQTRCFLDVRDAVRAITGLAEAPSAVGQVFNVGSTEEISILGLAQRVKALTGSPSEIVFIPYAQAYEEGFEDFQRRVPDISKLEQLLGYRPQYSLDETLQSVMDYFRGLEHDQDHTIDPV